jgi:hypothetical protein
MTAQFVGSSSVEESIHIQQQPGVDTHSDFAWDMEYVRFRCVGNEGVAGRLRTLLFLDMTSYKHLISTNQNLS